MHSIRLHDLLTELKRRCGSNSRLASAVGVSDKSVTNWLKKDNAALESSMHPNNVDTLLDYARRLGVELDLFRPPGHLWDPFKTYSENLTADIPPPPESNRTPEPHLRMNLFGLWVGSPFGAASSIATSTPSRIRYLAGTGADIITMKTVRAEQTTPHPWPNLYACDSSCSELLPDQRPEVVQVGAPDATFDFRYGAVNRFGMPSPSPEEWSTQYGRAKAYLGTEQLLLLSVAAKRTDASRPEDLYSDFEHGTEVAVSSGAEVVELNLSCPNCSGIEGDIFEDVDTARELVRRLRSRFPETKFVVKIGYLPQAKLEKFLIEIAAYIDGIAAINSYRVSAVRRGQELEPAFGEHFPGISGRPILPLGLITVRNIRTILEREKIGQLAILGMGGVTTPADVLNYLNEGADVVQAATAFLMDPLFGIRVHQALVSRGESRHLTPAQEEEVARQEWSRAVQGLELEFALKRDQLDAVSLHVWREWQASHRTTCEAGPRRRRALTNSLEFRHTIRQRLLREA